MTTRHAPVELRDGSELRLLVHVLPGDRGEDPEILVRTRTGTKIHLGSGGSSVTRCGVWLRVDGARMAIAPGRVDRDHLCESCFPLAASAAPTSEEETMTKSTTPRAEIEKRRRVAKKQAAEIGGTVERRGDEFVVVRSDAAVSAAVQAIEPVAELPASDPAAVDGAALAATLRERIAASIEGAELVASPTAIEHRVRLAGKTLAYVTPQKRSVRVTVTAEPRVKVKVDSPETIEAAVAAIDDAARTAAS